jgi:hypothetical protein
MATNLVVKFVGKGNKMMYADNCCTYEETLKDGVQGYVFTGQCIQTKKQYSVFVPGANLYKYRQGAAIQEAFPNMPREDREFLMSGVSPEGWKLLFSGEEDEE